MRAQTRSSLVATWAAAAAISTVLANQAMSAPAIEPATIPGGAAVGALTDHDVVVRRWGLEMRRVAMVQRSPGQDPSCGTDCPISLNSLGLRRWVSHRYAYNAGLVFTLGGGGVRTAGGTDSLDTFFGIGPTVGASFLLANWRHLTVSLSPQLDLVYFTPASSKGKTFLIGARGLLEGELHLGYWGLPQLSIGLSGGLAADLRFVTKPDDPVMQPMISSQWAVGTTGPQSLWALVTNAHVRFYF